MGRRPQGPRRVVAVGLAVAMVGIVSIGLLARGPKAEAERGDVHVVPVGPFTTPQVTSYLATRSGNITMALYDYLTGRTYLYRPGVSETTASIIKVEILATLLHEAEVAHQPLDDATADLATRMIENSDDNAAQALWDQEGGSAAVASFGALAGLTQTVPNSQGFWGLSTTTAADQLAVLKAVVYPNPLLDAPSRVYETGLMEDVEADQQWGVSGGVPNGVTVATKDGWDPLDDGTTWQINSIGWINGEGRDYLMAVLTNGNSSEGYGIQTIEGVAPLVWAYMAPAPQPTPATSKGQ